MEVCSQSCFQGPMQQSCSWGVSFRVQAWGRLCLIPATQQRVKEDCFLKLNSGCATTDHRPLVHQVALADRPQAVPHACLGPSQKAILPSCLQVCGSLPNTPTSVRSEYFTVPYGSQLDQHSSAVQDELPDISSFVNDVLGASEDEAQSVAGQEQVPAATPPEATGPDAGGGAHDAVAESSTAAGLPPAEQDSQMTLEGQQNGDVLEGCADAGPLLGVPAHDALRDLAGRLQPAEGVQRVQRHTYRPQLPPHLLAQLHPYGSPAGADPMPARSPLGEAVTTAEGNAKGLDAKLGEQLQAPAAQQGVGCRPSSAHTSRRRAPPSLLPGRPATAPRPVLPANTEGAEPSPRDSVGHRLRSPSPKQQQLRVVGLHVRSGAGHAGLEVSSGPDREGQGCGGMHSCSSEDGAETGGVPMDVYLTALRELYAAREAAAFFEHHCAQIMWVTVDDGGKQDKCMFAVISCWSWQQQVASVLEQCGYASFLTKGHQYIGRSSGQGHEHL